MTQTSMSDTQNRSDDIGAAGLFLNQASDEDLLRFLRRLPMIAGSEDGKLTVADLIYEAKLWPFVKAAWAKIQGSPGIAGRLQQMSEVYKTAEAELAKETGERRRTPRVISLPSFIRAYTEDGLP